MDPITRITQTIEDLRQLGQWIEAHPEIPGTMWATEYIVDTFLEDDGWRERTAAELLPFIRAMKEAGPVNKSSTTSYMTYEVLMANGQAKIRLITPRATVCTATVVGQRTVEVTDPDAPKITTTEDIIEWQCLPILAAEEA